MPRTPSSSRDSTSRCRCTSSTAGRGRAGWTATATPPCPRELPSVERLYLLIFTSGSTGAPKAVQVSQGRATRTGKAGAAAFTGDDVLYCSMPLFHGNALFANLFPAMVSGAAVALRPRFSASELLPDVRRFGCTYFNYVGRALSYVLAQPEQPDDGDNPLKWCLGSEASPARSQGVPAAVRLLRGRGLQLQRGRRRDHTVLRDAARGARAGPATGWTSRSSTPTPAPSARAPGSTTTAGSSTRRRRSARSSAAASSRPSRATTPTPRPPPSAGGTGGTGPATSATGTRTAPSTSPGAPPTGCASTARTSRPARSSGSSAATPAWRRPSSTACPIRGPATR